MIKPITPISISDEIRAFCRDIDATQGPVYLPVRSIPEAEINSCFGSVQDHIIQQGGSIKYGWIIWELSNVFLEAEFHAVWVSPSGELIDITPKIDNECMILFLPDSKRLYKDQIVDNRRKLLTVNNLTLEWLWRGHNHYLIKKKHFRNGKLNAKAANEELARWEESQRKAGIPKFGPDDSCPCGSGRKFRKCCRRSVLPIQNVRRPK
jgi:hypothetical protein